MDKKALIHGAQVSGLSNTISSFYNEHLFTDRSYFSSLVTAPSNDSIYRIMVINILESILSDIDSRTGQHSVYWMEVLSSKLFMIHNFCNLYGLRATLYYKRKPFLSLGKGIDLPYDSANLVDKID